MGPRPWQVLTFYQDLWDCELNGFRLLFLENTSARLTALCRLIQEMRPSDFDGLTDRDRMFAEGVSADICACGGKLDTPPADGPHGSELAEF